MASAAFQDIDRPQVHDASALSNRRRDALLALAAALVVLALHAAGGFRTLFDAAGDNDSLLRLVEVRDLLNGQGWFDLMQYRMGLDGGFLMHWSRLVDLPIALLILAAHVVTGDMPQAEMFAVTAWPTLLLALSLFCILRTARRLGGESAIFPALVVGAITLRFLNIFNPGSIDHHNVQLALALGVIVLLVGLPDARLRHAAAGALCAVMLAVGMETAPYVAAAILAVAIQHILLGRAAGGGLLAFGLGLTATAACCFVATVPIASWWVAQCDAYSTPQFAAAAGAGAALCCLAVAGAVSPWRRAVLAACAGAMLAAFLVGLFPQCLADPYAMVDPKLRTYWLDAVSEAQPIWRILRGDPSMIATYYATAMVALAWLATRAARLDLDRGTIIVGGFLVTAFAVACWQVRGSMFALPFAVIPLAVMIGRARAAAAVAKTAMPKLKMALAWLISFTVTWTAATAGATGLLGLDAEGGSGAPVGGNCQLATDYAPLAAEPETRVLASSNLGAPILRHTGHSVFAGPYHRNNAGNLLALSAFMEPLDAARSIVAGSGATLLAYCPGNTESMALARWAPDGLMAALMRGAIPDWLEPLPGTSDRPLRLFRIRALPRA